MQEVVWVRSLSTFVARSLQYIWWLYPIMTLFWPGKLRCLSRSRNRQSQDFLTNSQAETVVSRDRTSANSLNDYEDEASSVNSADDQMASGNTYLNSFNTKDREAMFGGAQMGPDSATYFIVNNKTGSNFTSTQLASPHSSSNTVYQKRDTFGTLRSGVDSCALDKSSHSANSNNNTMGGHGPFADEPPRSGNFAMVSPNSDNSSDRGF